MGIEKRMEKLEERTANHEVVILVRYSGDNTEPTEAQERAAIANFKAKHPEREIIVLYWKDGQFKDN